MGSIKSEETEELELMKVSPADTRSVARGAVFLDSARFLDWYLCGIFSMGGSDLFDTAVVNTSKKCARLLLEKYQDNGFTMETLFFHPIQTTLRRELDKKANRMSTIVETLMKLDLQEFPETRLFRSEADVIDILDIFFGAITLESLIAYGQLLGIEQLLLQLALAAVISFGSFLRDAFREYGGRSASSDNGIIPIPIRQRRFYSKAIGSTACLRPITATDTGSFSLLMPFSTRSCQRLARAWESFWTRSL